MSYILGRPVPPRPQGDTQDSDSMSSDKPAPHFDTVNLHSDRRDKPGHGALHVGNSYILARTQFQVEVRAASGGVVPGVPTDPLVRMTTSLADICNPSW